MQSIVLALYPIFLSLFAGSLSSRLLSLSIRRVLICVITPLIWALLFTVGFEFGGVLDSVSRIVDTLQRASVLAALTTAVPMLLIAATRRLSSVSSQIVLRRPAVLSRASTGASLAASTAASMPRMPMPYAQPSARSLLWRPVRDCAIALAMVCAGVGLALWHGDAVRSHGLMGSHGSLSLSTYLLYGLLFLVGLDLSDVTLDRSWFSRRTLSVPLMVIAGSLVGGAAAAYLLKESWATSLALASGFGWFSLSGILVGHALGDAYGALALMTDLLRELLAIVLLYVFGRRWPRACIGASGATALDSTLPIIKQRCPPGDLPTALMTGLVLTLAAPFMIRWFLSL